MTEIQLGEIGSGQELSVRAIHAHSDRRDKRLIRVNCAAIPAGLRGSESFGHERGAVTGATRKRGDCFALADSGTLFLEERGRFSHLL